MTARAALAAALLLAGCSKTASGPEEVQLLSSGAAEHGHSVSPDGRRAAWVRGAWPDRTALTLLDMASGERRSIRLKGYSLVETAFDADGTLKVLARRVGASESPRDPPRQAAILTVDGSGGLLSAEDAPPGRIIETRAVPWHQPDLPPVANRAEGTAQAAARGPRGSVWVASVSLDGARYAVESFDEQSGKRLLRAELPGPAESLLATEHALYVLTRSSESLSGAPRGPRLLTKVDLPHGRPLWSVPWAPRRSALLARSPEGRLFAAVKDPEAPSLWSFSDRPQAAAAAGASAAAPGAARARRLRTAGLYLVRFLPVLILALLFLSFR